MANVTYRCLRHGRPMHKGRLWAMTVEACLELICGWNRNLGGWEYAPLGFESKYDNHQYPYCEAGVGFDVETLPEEGASET